MKTECEKCGGEGYIVYDYFEPTDFYGHGQVEEKCDCQLDKTE